MTETGELRFETVVLEFRDGVGVLTVNRPQQMNALSKQVLEDLSAALDRAARDPAVRVIVITGQGPKAFVAGADISEMEALDCAGAREFSRFGQDVFEKIETCPKPVIAAVNGYALGGGCELALSCDIRIAAANARFGQPETGLGITPGFGGTQRLARLAGRAAAMELIFTGCAIDANEAFRMGLVNKVVPEGEAVEEAVALSREIMKKSSFAVSQAKKAIAGGLSLNQNDGLRLEERLFSECFAHPHQKEGMRAFLEKRKARY